MTNSFLPPGIGYTLQDNNGNTNSVVIGKDTTLSWTAVGTSVGGQPSAIQDVLINITNSNATNILNQTPTTISFSLSDILAIQQNNTNAPSIIDLKFQEIFVCVNGTKKSMTIIGSDPYDPAS